MNRAILMAAVFAAATAGVSLSATAGSGSKMLERYDSNADGAIDRDEFMTGRDDWFAKLDANNDGVVTETEFDEAIAQFRTETGSERRGPDFSKIDSDEDGSATRAEFEAAAERMFTRFDRNGDGVLSPDDRKENEEG
ncbi:MAG: EF-hand domain-containing protein [Rhodospirillaceae bacterium]|nr:EF-hand domain-containing protein [Rhodospirillaceae bacterium]